MNDLELKTLILNTSRFVMLQQEEQKRTNIDEEIIETALDRALQSFNDVDDDILEYVKGKIRSKFIVSFASESVILSDSSTPPWIDNKRGSMEWHYWDAYKEFLLEEEERSPKLINDNSIIIDRILDMTGDPTLEGSWSRRGLVMGNVQSGKTQNFIGLLNKAADVGYKIIIILGGHQNELRKQTQIRLDQGLMGLESSHIGNNIGRRKKIGVGLYRAQNKIIHSFTSSLRDFSKEAAEANNYQLADAEGAPIIFCVKKNATILKSLFQWLTQDQGLTEGNKHKAPLLFIDDEADYASINSKAGSKEITRINSQIRSILTLFSKSTYIGYTATPFANIFINPELGVGETGEAMGGDEESAVLEEDLFPKNFLIKIPTPSEYCGQDYFFPENPDWEALESPVKIIEDSDQERMLKLYGHKKEDVIGDRSDKLEEAIRCFILNIAIKKIRIDKKTCEEKHDTFLLNMTHLNALQIQIKDAVEEYLESCKKKIYAFYKLPEEKYDPFMVEIKNTFENEFAVEETWEEIIQELNWAVQKIKVFIVNSAKPRVIDGIPEEPFDYSLHPEGLAAIAIGGHKLSRGLTLEGLSISYFARNSKSYDTLMQMCRWFGYRPGYKDLCKLYTIQQSVDHYTFISGAIRDLYSELDLMYENARTPADFGLKVRNHPGGLIITARNRMGTAESQVASIDMWGQRIRRFRFINDSDINKKNLEITENFIKKLNEKNFEIISSDIGNSKIYSNVPAEEIIQFMEEFQIKGNDQFYTDENIIRLLRTPFNGTLPTFKVCIYSGDSQGTKFYTEHVKDQLIKGYSLGDIKITPGIRRLNRISQDNIYSASLELGSKDDEKLFLNEKEREEVKENSSDSNLLNSHYIRHPERNFFGLTIYLFNLVKTDPIDVKKENEQDLKSAEMVFPDPGVSYALSIPSIESLADKDNAELRRHLRETRIEYMVNQVWRDQQMDLYNETEDDYGKDDGDE